MNILLAAHGKGFLPADEYAESLRKRMTAGEVMMFKVLKPRSLPMHRMYFGICRSIADNQDPQRDESSIDMELRFRAGHKELIGMYGGEELWIPKRIAFDKLSHDEWMALWPSLELAIRQTFGNEYIRD